MPCSTSSHAAALGLLALVASACSKPASHGEAEAGALGTQPPPASSPADPNTPSAPSAAASGSPTPDPASAPDPSAATPPDSPAPSVAAPFTVRAALAQPPGATVRIEASSFGWQGPCRGEVPSRSAWQLADGASPDSACLYVDGALPRGQSPTSPHPVPVRVVGVLRELPDGSRYLEPERVEPR